MKINSNLLSTSVENITRIEGAEEYKTKVSMVIDNFIRDAIFRSMRNGEPFKGMKDLCYNVVNHFLQEMDDIANRVETGRFDDDYADAHTVLENVFKKERVSFTPDTRSDAERIEKADVVLLTNQDIPSQNGLWERVKKSTED